MLWQSPFIYARVLVPQYIPKNATDNIINNQLLMKIAAIGGFFYYSYAGLLFRRIFMMDKFPRYLLVEMSYLPY